MAGMLVNGPAWFGGPWDRYGQESTGTPESEDSIEQNRENAESDDRAGAPPGGEDASLKRLEPRVKELEKMDKAVREHEQLHKAVAGPYAGEITYRFVTGPDGKRYAVGGSTPLGAPQCRRPEETIMVMNKLRQAAMAPGDPSPEDLRVARLAAMREQEARAEIRSESAEMREQDSERMLEKTGLWETPEVEIKKDSGGQVEIKYHRPEMPAREVKIPRPAVTAGTLHSPGSSSGKEVQFSANNSINSDTGDIPGGQGYSGSAGKTVEVTLPGASKPESGDSQPGESLPGAARKPESIGEAYRMAARIYRQQALLSIGSENHR